MMTQFVYNNMKKLALTIYYVNSIVAINFTFYIKNILTFNSN